MINFGTAFTAGQRAALGLTGLLPSAVTSMDAQLRRVHRQFADEPSDIAKYIFLNTMQDRNETLFYRLLTENIEEMLPTYAKRDSHYLPAFPALRRTCSPA